MSNPFYYLVGLLLFATYPAGFEPLLFAEVTWAAPAAAAVAVLLLAAASAGLHEWLDRGGRRHLLGLARVALRLLALVAFAALVFVFHLPLALWGAGLEDALFLGPVAALIPLMAMGGALALVSARFDTRARGSGGGVLFAFRSFVAFSLVPLLSMLALQALLERVDALRRLAYVHPTVGGAAILVWSALLLFLLPPLIRLAFAARPLEPGPLRSRLEEICRTSGFRCRDLLVISTARSGLANAFIVGLVAPLRYVFFTDALLSGMSTRELECVLAHEIVHSTRRHILFFLLFAMGSVLAALPALEGMGNLPPVAVSAIFLAWSVAYWFAAFGFISRRFETEADLGAARLLPPGEERPLVNLAPGGPPASPFAGAWRMAAALERVAELNRMPTSGWSWRHFNIDTRVGILIEAGERPESGASWERSCRRLRAGAVAVLAVGLAGAGWLAAREAAEAPAARQRLEAVEQARRGLDRLRAGRADDASVEFRSALGAGLHGDGWLWMRLADSERAAGREEEALEAERRGVREGLVDPRDRLRVAR